MGYEWYGSLVRGVQRWGRDDGDFDEECPEEILGVLMDDDGTMILDPGDESILEIS